MSSASGGSFTTEKLFPEEEGSMEGGGGARMAPASHVATAIRLFYAVLPNPATDQLQVSYQKADEAEEAFILTDITGRTVEQATLAGTSGTKVMDLRSLQSGMYLYRIMNGKAVKQSGKISKQ